MFVGLYRLAPGILDALAIVRPETVVRWISIIVALEIQAARRETEHPAGDPWADPGHEPGQPALGRTPHPWRTTEARHRCRPDQRCKVHGSEEGRPSQGWRTFLCYHADGIASMDLFVVPTLSFRLLYGLLILRHRRLTEACGWEAAPDYVVPDRDCVYGEAYIRRLRMMGIRDRPTPSSRREGRIPQRALRPARARLASSSAHPPDAVLPHELGTTLLPMAAASFMMS